MYGTKYTRASRIFERMAEDLTKGDYANRLLSTMRKQFGGYVEKRAGR